MREIQKFGSQHEKLQEKRKELMDTEKVTGLATCDKDIRKILQKLQYLWAQYNQCCTAWEESETSWPNPLNCSIHWDDSMHSMDPHSKEEADLSSEQEGDPEEL